MLNQLIPHLLVLFSLSLGFQTAPERTAPFAAVKWEGEKPQVLLQEQWYTLLSIEKVAVARIIAHCKEKRKDRWQKYFSEDIVQVMEEMGTPLPSTVELSLSQKGKNITRKEAMTADNRRKVRDFNNQQAAPSNAASANN